MRQQVDRVRYEANGTRVRHVSRDVLIQSSAGLDIWRDVTVQYVADRERVALVRLEIVKPSGERVRPSNLALAARRQSGVFEQKVFGDLMERHVTVPSLAVGDLLSYEMRVDTTVPQAGGAFWGAHTFYTAAPMDDEVLEVEVPASVPVAVWTRPGQAGPETDAVSGQYRLLRWRRTGYRPAPQTEQRSIEALLLEDDEAAGADVHVSSLVRWTDVGRWYRDVLAKVAAPGANIAAKARELTAEAASPEDKLRALYRFVATEVHYVSLAFGIGRHEPRPAELVLQTGYGDCKDKHTLLAALAREIGVTLDPVLIGAQTALDEDAPSPAQFDHLISVWRRDADPDRWLWLDSTSGMTGPGHLLPNLRDKQALLVDAAGTFPLVSTPRGRQALRMEFRVVGTLEADGAQQMTIRRVAHGDHGLMFRMLQPVMQGSEQVKELAGQLLGDDGIGSSKVATASLDVPADWDAPVELSYTAQVTYNLAPTIKKRAMWIPSPTLWLPDPDKLATPWRLPFEDAAQSRVTTNYTLPEGWSAEVPVDVELTQPFARYRSRYVVAGRQLTIERELDISAVVLTEEDRAAYTRFRKAVIDDRGQQFGLTIPVAPAPTDATAGVDLEERVRQAWDSGRVTQARDLLLELIAAEPRHPRAWNNLGRAYLALGDANAAVEPLERQVAVDPVHPNAYNNLGNAYRGLGRHADAEAAYRKHIEIAPLDRWGHLNLGLTLLAQQRRPDALASLERAAAASREDPFVRLRVGQAFLRAGEQARAVALFEEVVEVNPPHPGYLNDAAYWLADAGIELPRARAWADRAIALAHGALGGATLAQIRDANLTQLNVVINLWDTRGWIAFKEGDLATARLWLEAAHDWSDSGEVAMHVGRLREQDGRPAEAVRAYARVANGTRMTPRGRVPAVEALTRLAKAGHTVPGDAAAADVGGRQSSVTVPDVPAAVSGEVFVAIGTEGTVEEALLGAADGPDALADALKGVAVPGADIARLRQVRLFRKAAFDCAPGGACTLVWQRMP